METKCSWATTPELISYHDNEWGVPEYDDTKIFEFLLLEMMQAGLSWATILRKRENFRAAFDNFNPKIIANYGEEKIAQLLNDEGIIRNKLKVRAAVSNAQLFLQIQKEYGSFSKFIWNYVDNKTIVNYWTELSQLPAQTELSIRISKDLKKRGFSFVGPTIIYSFMQAIGMVDDHMVGCRGKERL